ncbi:alpha/beta hydrolase [uncultured Piscinibacter sp.]|uniref:alpha/beta fold hydrolase n=1 Tax=uncultured Piscinibacter sp. TaxID=1131835 RepID=UPI00260F7815|nr:alpha/beta hydrolase [uncultured Piscinibacter sp.]
MNRTLPIVFSHANGFPAGTYRLLFEAWRRAGHAVHALDKFGHDPAYPVTSNWPRLRDQLIDFIDREVGGPAVLVGHSLGGLLSLLAACKRPDLARGLVMIDSPVITGWRAQSLQVVKTTGLVRRVSPGRVSRTRRHEWPSRDAVRRHFAAKAVFARWDPRVLEDYVRSGFEDRDGKTVLAFDRAIETRIYDTLPHHLATLLHRHPVRCPVAFLAGTQSAEMRQGGIAASKALAHGRFAMIEGSHLFPMEKPDETAAAVLQWVEGMAP